MERKEFIKHCGKLCLGGFLANALLESCTGNYYALNTIANNEVIVNKKEFVEVKEGKTKERKYVLVRTDKLIFPICIYRLNENTYSALYMECTHKSCELSPHGDYLICPCHGSEFSNIGKVQNPPAESNLQTFKVTIHDENIHIHLA